MNLKPVFLMLVLVFAFAAVPAFAQDDPRDRALIVDDFGLTFHRAIVQNATITEYAGDSPEYGPGFSDAPHTNIMLFNNGELPESPIDTVASIRVYHAEVFQDYPFLAEQVDALRALLDERPDLAQFSSGVTGENSASLPYVPVLPHGQLLNARAQYVETDEVRGIVYLTASNATLEPFMSSSFAYTFQGLSTDGAYYISATMPLETDLFPAQLEPIDPEAFAASWLEYLEQSIETLNTAAPEAFEPSLGVLDGLIQTFEFTE